MAIVGASSLRSKVTRVMKQLPSLIPKAFISWIFFISDISNHS